MRSLLALAVSAIATLALVSGCSSSDDDGDTSSVAAAASASSDFCETFCGKVADCDKDHDAQTCTKKCEKDMGPMFGKMRADVVQNVRACWTATQCRDVSGDRLADCLDEAAVGVTPSRAATDLCDALGKNLEKCDGSMGRAACLSKMKIYSDGTLGEASTCMEKSCSAIAGCVNATL